MHKNLFSVTFFFPSSPYWIQFFVRDMFHDIPNINYAILFIYFFLYDDKIIIIAIQL